MFLSCCLPKGQLPRARLKTLSGAVILPNWTARSYIRQTSVKYQMIFYIVNFFLQWSIGASLSLNISSISFCDAVRQLMEQTLALIVILAPDQARSSQHVMYQQFIPIAILSPTF